MPPENAFQPAAPQPEGLRFPRVQRAVDAAEPGRWMYRGRR